MNREIGKEGKLGHSCQKSQENKKNRIYPRICHNMRKQGGFCVFLCFVFMFSWISSQFFGRSNLAKIFTLDLEVEFLINEFCISTSLDSYGKRELCVVEHPFPSRSFTFLEFRVPGADFCLNCIFWYSKSAAMVMGQWGNGTTGQSGNGATGSIKTPQ